MQLAKNKPETETRKVVALCVHAKGHYQTLLGPENCWDIHRDARSYTGTDAVVAHPPCGPWGRLSHMCKNQDAEVALHCVDHVRRCGGVLEHPAHSRLWEYCGMSRPGYFPDIYGGYTIPTTLAAFGGDVMKKTWVYVVRPLEAVRAPFRTHIPTSTVEQQWSWERQITPIRMARWLIETAATTQIVKQEVA